MRQIKVKSTITDTRIHVTTDHTNFVNLWNVEPVAQEDFAGKVKALAKKCRESGVRFSRKGAKEILERFDEYQTETAEYRDLFFEVKEMWEGIVEEGIYAPTVENEKMNEAAKLSAKMSSKWNRSQIMSKVHGVLFTIDRYMRDTRLSGYKKISI